MIKSKNYWVYFWACCLLCMSSRFPVSPSLFSFQNTGDSISVKPVFDFPRWNKIFPEIYSLKLITLFFFIGKQTNCVKNNNNKRKCLTWRTILTSREHGRQIKQRRKRKTYHIWIVYIVALLRPKNLVISTCCLRAHAG